MPTKDELKKKKKMTTDEEFEDEEDHSMDFYLGQGP